MRSVALGHRIALGGALACAGGLFLDARYVLASYVASFSAALFCVLGMLFFVLLHHVTDAGWSTIARRWAENFTAALPALGVLFAPVLLGAGALYHWTHDAHLAPAKAAWLDLRFFVFRAFVYFGVWLGLAAWYRRGSLAQDDAPDPERSLAMRRRAGPALVAYALTTAFAAIDWLMTLDHHWYSTIFGVYAWSHGVLAAMAVLALVARRLRRGPLRDRIGEERVHDLGKWVFAFAVFWAYVAFSQYMLIWYANIPEETHWMVQRGEGTWLAVAVLVAAACFGAPFVLLLAAGAKRSPLLGAVSWIVLAGTWLGFLWIAVPAAAPGGVRFALLWIDAGALAVVLGVAGEPVRRAFARHPLYPRHDPRLPEALPAAEEA